jgi:cardiolipin synthase C
VIPTNRLASQNGVLLAALLSILAGCASITIPESDPEARAAFVARLQARDSCVLTVGPCVIESPLRERTRAAAHDVLLLEHGREALIARVNLIRSAHTSIEFQTFIWDDDEVGHLMLAELARAAGRGVRVRLLIDQFGAFGSAEATARAVTLHPGMTVRYYNPVFGEADTDGWDITLGLACCSAQFNGRMHNKALVIDGVVGITGGRNVANRYFDHDPEFNFMDRDVLVSGPAVAQMQASFEAYWDYELTVPAQDLEDVAELMTEGFEANDWEEVLQIPESMRTVVELALHPVVIAELAAKRLPVERVTYFWDEPSKPFEQATAEGRDLTAEMRRLLTQAQDEIIIQTPYLVFSGPGRRLFSGIRDADPNLRILVSTNSLASTDAFPVYAISVKQRKRMVKNYGFEIHEIRPRPVDMDLFIPGLPFSDHGRPVEVVEGCGDLGLLMDGPQAIQRRRIHAACEETGVIPVLPLPVSGEGIRLSLHSKSFVIDREISWIGSHNFDPRSDRINTESGLIIWDPTFAEHLAGTIEQHMQAQNSWVVAKVPEIPVISYFSGIIGTISRALPIFDLWPFHYTTLYALRDGEEPVPASHPEFYQRYEEVGDYPEVALTLKQIQTSLISAMGGWGAPIL